ncbi:hypothetical protein DPMN_124354 [Dreissena polymorpha]|uniref:Uncharacterized protein n=1 Tax=Dreissena polymorpha TaxID=45954 RepID=A0A9D4GVX0_DREPO|nr:hypothetical protein DPMN_124354 [Dreissena polymorpha]
MLTSNSSKRDYAMFEKEIVLPMKSSVLKVITSLGAMWFRKSLVIRPVDAQTCRLASMSRAQRIPYRLTHGSRQLYVYVRALTQRQSQTNTAP